jgi:hypothetical protein
MGDQARSRSLGSAIKARRQAVGWTQEPRAARMVDAGDDTFRQSDVSRLELGKVGLPHSRVRQERGAPPRRHRRIAD